MTDAPIRGLITEQKRNSFDGKLSRTIETTYTLPTDNPNIWRELTISTHYNARRYYYGSVNRCKVEREVHDYGTFICSSHNLFEGDIVPTTVIERGVTRYSVKRLRELHDGWLASVQEYGIPELIEWAEAAK